MMSFRTASQRASIPPKRRSESQTASIMQEHMRAPADAHNPLHTHMHRYLSDADFLASFGMTLPEYRKLPAWRQKNKKVW